MVAADASGQGQGRPAGGVVFLAVSGELSGRALSIWKKVVDERQQLRLVVENWARAHDVLDSWACDLPRDVRATAGPGGRELDLNFSVKSLTHLLPITGAGLSVTIIWPFAKEQTGSKASRSASGLGKLRISTRYANVNRDISGYHKSSTMKAKLDAGEYDQTSGKFVQSGFIEAMRTPSLPSACSGASPDTADSQQQDAMATRTLVVVGRKPGVAGNIELFRAALKGPTSLVLNWEATCSSFDKKNGAGKSIPYPVFLPTHRRAQRANLNWNAPHVFGPFAPGKEGKLQPVICIVVEPSQEDDYREAWPHALTLVLPANGRGPGFARWAIQKICTRSIERPPHKKADSALPDVSSWPVRRLPWVWIADDGISMFYRLVNSKPMGTGSTAKIQRLTEREAPEGKAMFREALMTVQRHALLPQMAIAGFLRDDGTAVCKRLEWKKDELALYKIVLLNLPVLRRLGVEYQPDLQMYEDICFCHEVLRSKGHTLKCQNFCFRASHVKAGGCSEQRTHRLGTHLEDLMAPSALKRLPSERQQAVQDLLKWVQSKETKFGTDDDPHQGSAPARREPTAKGPRNPKQPLLKRKREKKEPKVRVLHEAERW